LIIYDIKSNSLIRVIGVHPTVVGMWSKMSSELGYCLIAIIELFLYRRLCDGFIEK